MEGESPIHQWEVSKRFGWTEGDRRIEFDIEGRGDRSVLRLEQSGFTDDAKSNFEFEALNGGWKTFFGALEHCL
jgi:hypothetical protein